MKICLRRILAFRIVVLKSVGTLNYYFLITYGVCKKRKYCNRMSKKKNSLLLTNVHDLYVLEDKTSKKKCPPVRLSVRMSVRPYVCLSGCTYVRGLFMWTQ